MRIFYLFMIFMVFGKLTYSQSSFEVGSFIAPQKTWLLHSPLLNVKGLPTYHLSYGFYGALMTSQKIGFGIGINISYQGQKYNFTTIEKENFLQEITLKYIQYPVYVLYEIPVKDNFSLVIKSGIQYGQKKEETIFDGTMNGMSTVVYFGNDKLDILYGLDATFAIFSPLKLFIGTQFAHSMSIAQLNKTTSLVFDLRMGAKYVF